MKLAFLEKELNKKFSSYPRKGYIELHTKSKRIAKKYGFLEENEAYHKLVSPYEVTEYYFQSFTPSKKIYWKMQNKNLMNFNKNTIERVCHKR